MTTATPIKTLFDKKADVAKVHEKGKSIDLKTAVNGFSIPLHPGVIKYYKEKGVLRVVDGEGSIPQVYERIITTIKKG